MALETSEAFVIGGAAASIAVTVTNPFEVLKTRMQLDGELAASPDQRRYKGVADAMRQTWRHEGVKGLSRGLGAAYLYQISLNGCRLGLSVARTQRTTERAATSRTAVS